jgi:parvulin-like peptidyl-prolyl isomerase
MKMNATVPFDNLNEEDKLNIVNQVVERELLKLEATKDGIEKSTEFKKAIDEQKAEIGLELWMKKEFDKISIKDDDAKKFYDTEKDKFKEPARLKATHILLKTEDEAKAIIKTLSEANVTKESFNKVASEKSIDPSAKDNKGDLGWFMPTQMVKPFSEACQKLKAGEMTKEPVKSDFGYHIIYLEDSKAETTTAFDTVKGQIVQYLKMKKLKDIMMAKAKNAKAKAKVDIKFKPTKKEGK